MAAPKFEGPDGVLRNEYVFSTTLPFRFFAGTMDERTVDMQVSVRGGAFTSDPDLISFEGTSFVIPNPSAFPEGLQLLPGDNEIQLKSVLSNGTVTQAALINGRLVQEGDVGAAIAAPSGVSVERFDRIVRITVEGLDDPNVQGYHFYASTQPGGGTSGYNRINPALVVSGETTEVFTPLAEMTVDSTVATNSDGTAAADPLFLSFRAAQEDQDDAEIQVDFDESLEVPETSTRLRTTVAVDDVRTVRRFSFVHDRQSTFESAVNPAIPNSEFNAIPSSDPLYYVVTAVYFIDGQELESALSPEVSGAPLTITPNVGAFPQVTRQAIVRATVLSIFRSQPQLDVKPGSVLRDTFIDPFSSEAERIRFLIDFMHRAQSFSTLLPIDDPTLSGESIPVSQSPYKLALKQALYLESDEDVQSLIDNTFDKLASNYGITRRPGRRSRGECVIFTRRRPTSSINFGLGETLLIGGDRFLLTSSVSITASGSGAFFNPATGRYSARAFIQSESPGAATNKAAGLTGSVEGSPLPVTVLLESPTFGGTDEESNRDLAARAMGVLSSVDSGTLQGYVQSAVNVPGVSQVNVVEAGHPLMMRDRNDSGKHVGGKVDIWLRGQNLATVSDSFAFSFEIAQNVQFEPVGDPTSLKFRAVDSKLSQANPIIEMLSIPSIGMEFVNESTGKVYDLTNVQIVAYNAIQLDTELNDPSALDLSDVIRGSYRYRTSNKHVFTRQPVVEIVRFVGEVSGLLDTEVYDLFRASDPLELGRSNEAGDYIQVTQPDELPAGVTIPSSTPLTVAGESHVILNGIEYVNRMGANPLTVRVFNADRTVEYTGPYVSSDPDFTIIDGTATTPLGIKATAGSAIVEGQTLLFDYQHDENFTVQYVTNAVVGLTQNVVDPKRHITADVIAKLSVDVPVDISGTIVLENSLNRQVSVTTVDGAVRTAMGRFFGALVQGEPVRQSDILGVIERVEGVSYVVTPLTKMVKGNGALVVRETVFTDQDADVVHVTAWSKPTVNVWLLRNPLASATSNAGGPSNEFRGVFADEVRLTHHETAPDVNGIPIRNSTGGAFIIGSGGLDIPGYSDDATLKAKFPFATDHEIDQERIRLTQNRVLVTLPTGSPTPSPTDVDYAVTYVVQGDTGVKAIEPGPTAHLVLGALDFAFDEDRDFRARVQGRAS